MEKFIRIQIPNQIAIGCHKYNVYFSKVIDIDGHDGTTNYILQQIWLAPALPESLRCVTILHEILHIVARTYIIKLNDADIDALAEGISQFLISNLKIKFDWSKIKEIHK